MSLKPQNLLQAAEADLRRRRYNVHMAETRGSHCGMYEQYAFCAAHVRRAKDVRQLLVMALMQPPPIRMNKKTGEMELATAKVNTKMIYGNGALLVAALKMGGISDETQD